MQATWGHASLSTTERYLHARPNDSSLIFSTAMIDHHRIQEYAKQLCSEREMEYILLSYVSSKFYSYFQELISQSKSKAPHSYPEFFATPELIATFKSYFSEKLNQQFWLNLAEFILTTIESHKQSDSIIDVQPDILPQMPSALVKAEQVAEEMAKHSCALYIVEEWIEQLNVQNLSIDELAAILGFTSKSAPVTELPLFINKSTVPIPLCSPPTSASRSMLKSWEWQEDDNNNVFFRDNYDTGVVEMFLKELDAETTKYLRLTGEAAWELVKQFGELGKDAVKLHWIISAYIFKQAEPWNTEIKLAGTGKKGGSHLIDLMGWGERKDMTIAQKLIRIERCLFLLRRLDATIKWNEGELGYDFNSLIWHIDTLRYGKRNSLTGEVDRPKELVAFIRAGRWAEFFLKKQGNNTNSRTALSALGRIAESTLKLNPYHEELEFLLALNLATDNAIHESGKYPVIRLLEKVMPKSKIEAARDIKYKAQDLKSRWDKALLRLTELGWQIEYDSKTYPAWLRPGSQAKKPKTCKHRIIEMLLSAKLTIFSPQKIPTLKAATAEPSAKPKRGSQSTLKWEPIQKACERRGWVKQTVIAQKLKISQQLVSKLKRGHPISSQTAAKLKKVLPVVLPELSGRDK